MATFNLTRQHTCYADSCETVGGQGQGCRGWEGQHRCLPVTWEAQEGLCKSSCPTQDCLPHPQVCWGAWKVQRVTFVRDIASLSSL